MSMQIFPNKWQEALRSAVLPFRYTSTGIASTHLPTDVERQGPIDGRALRHPDNGDFS